MKTLRNFQSIIFILISLFATISFSQNKVMDDLAKALQTNEVMLQGYEEVITQYIKDKSIDLLIKGILDKNSKSSVSPYLNTGSTNIQTSAKVLQLIQSEYKILLTNQKLIYNEMFKNSSFFERENINNRINKYALERKNFSKSLLQVTKDLPMLTGKPIQSISQNRTLGVTGAALIGGGTAVLMLAFIIFSGGLISIIGLSILGISNITTGAVMLALKAIVGGTFIIGGIAGGYTEYLNQQQAPLTKEILEMRTELNQNINSLGTIENSVLSGTQMP